MSSLTRTEAVERSSTVTVRSYEVALDVTGDGDEFDSSTRIVFDAVAGRPSTFVEVRPHELRSAVLNGEKLPRESLVDGRLPLTPLAGENELVVEARMAYSGDGQGMHRYRDPADGRTYLYCNASVDAAPRVLACFDQPDLKAPFRITVTAPPDWTVIGSGSATRAGDRRWELAWTPPLSTYLVTLAAGPYRSVHREHEGVRLGLHARAALADALEAQSPEMFDVTAACMDEYHRLFAVPYPFGQYDQVFVPEFGNLAMEGPGCVLIRDQFVFGSAATGGEREDRAGVIAHEMSHMWFGNLVTMAWWDDLWLNESFADYMGHRVTSAVTRFPSALTTFSACRKGEAYAADQRPSTHPVAADAGDVDTALTRFDRISYFKGSAVLRQLVHRIGDEAFLAGLRRYFRRHAHGTAMLTDLLSALQEAHGGDLTGWADRWLRSAQVSTLDVAVEQDGDGVVARVRQTVPDEHPVLRPHRLRIGLYGDGDPQVLDADIDGPLTEVRLPTRRVPPFVLLNDGDLTYAKIRFAPSSLAALTTVLPTLSPVNRAMVWGQLLLAVRDGEVSAAAHLDLALRTLPGETEPSIVAELLRQAKAEVVDLYLDPDRRPDALRRLADALRALLGGIAVTDERRLIAVRALIDATAGVAELRDWLRSGRLPGGVEVDDELAWRVRVRLAVLGDLDEDELDAAFAADRSSRGERFRAHCAAARPDPVAKHRVWTQIADDAELSHVGLWSLAEGFWQPEQVVLTAPYVARFFDDLPGMVRRRDGAVVGKLVAALFPRFAATASTVEQARALLDTDQPVALRQKLIDMTDDLDRVVRARERWT